MTFISSTPQHPHVLPRCRDRTPAAADDLAGPLAFSVTGLLTHGLALLTQGDDACLMLLNFALIASTPC
jgi:hypothetical protein